VARQAEFSWHQRHPRRDRSGNSGDLIQMADELVRMERINKYFGRVQALNDVTLSVRKNEIVGLLGDDGAGKSTLQDPFRRTQT
jgi:ABC-type polysaccharide/polyol phosphate transport system ATPase subunit